MSDPSSEIAPDGRSGADPPGDDPTAISGLRPESARRLAEAGYSTPESIQVLDDDRLSSLGLDAEDIERVRSWPANGSSASRESSSPAGRGVDRWVDRVKHTERPRRRPGVGVPAKDSASVLKKWVDGDDRAMETWIQSAEPTRSPPPAGPSAPARPTPSGPSEEGVALPPGGPAPSPGAGLPSSLVEREETVVRWLTDLLDRVRSDQFDPSSILHEVQELHRNLFEEQAKRKQLEEELEHVKRGSIAVIKYVRSREAKARDQAIQAKDAEIAELRLKVLTSGGGRPPEGGADAGEPGEAAPAGPGGLSPEAERRLREELQSREAQFLDRETELRRRIVQLEGEIRNLRAEAGVVQQREELQSQPEGQLSENLARMMREADARERELVLRENELRTRFEEIRIGSEDLERKRAPLALRETELENWEAQLNQTRQELEIEARKLEANRAEDRPAAKATDEELHQLELLRNELVHKQAEQKAREAYLQQKLEELETLQRRGIEPDTERITAGPSSAAGKIRTGVRRLDDLLFGGFPPGSQLIVGGPAHSGKEILARLFMTEGLKQGIPAVWVVTDKTYTQIREEMTQLFPGYPEFEGKGLVRYVDLYSRSLGVTQTEPGVRLLSSSDKGVLEQLNQAVNNATADFRDRATRYRIVFESVSTLSQYLDTASLFRFLQPFSGRRKLDGAAGYYLLETGMHTESDLQSLEHMMDGSLTLKIEQLKTFLSVKGIGEVQSRAWIGYTFSKKAFSLGSFSLDHIR